MGCVQSSYDIDAQDNQQQVPQAAPGRNPNLSNPGRSRPSQGSHQANGHRAGGAGGQAR